MSDFPFVGNWTYRSLLNDPSQFFDSIDSDLSEPEKLLKDPKKCLADLKQVYGLFFGYGTITIAEAPLNILRGTIGGSGWSLDLHGSRSYGNPMEIRFEGKGTIGAPSGFMITWDILCPSGKTACNNGRRWSDRSCGPSRIRMAAAA